MILSVFVSYTTKYAFRGLVSAGGHGFSRAEFRPSGGERSLAGSERSEPPDRIEITIRTPAGVAGSPRAPAAAGTRWSRRHGFQGFAKGAHPWLSSSRSSAVGATEVVPSRFSFAVVNRSDSGASGKRARGDTEEASAEAAAWIRPDPASVRRNLQHRPRTTERVLRLSRYAGPRICRRGCAVGRPPIDRKARRR